MQDADANVRRYPESVSLRGLLYFVLAPTLCYQEYFPRTSRVRPAYLASARWRISEAVPMYSTMLCCTPWTHPTAATEKEFDNKTPSHNTGHGTGAHWH